MVSRRKIIWAPSALQDLKEIFDYIHADNPEAAGDWVEQVLNRVEKLALFPKMGRTIPELGQIRYRELVLGDYRVFHGVTDKEVRIFRILHSRKFFPL